MMGSTLVTTSRSTGRIMVPHCFSPVPYRYRTASDSLYGACALLTCPSAVVLQLDLIPELVGIALQLSWDGLALCGTSKAQRRN